VSSTRRCRSSLKFQTEVFEAGADDSLATASCASARDGPLLRSSNADPVQPRLDLASYLDGDSSAVRRNTEAAVIGKKSCEAAS